MLVKGNNNYSNNSIKDMIIQAAWLRVVISIWKRTWPVMKTTVYSWALCAKFV